jgi:hypothetical protein
VTRLEASTAASDAEAPAQSTHRAIPFAWPLGAVFVVVMLGYGLWAAFTGHGYFLPVRVGYGPDSAIYIHTSRSPVWSLKFLAAADGGPFLYLVLVKLCLRNLRAIVLVQSVLAAAAWLFLAYSVAKVLRRPWLRSVAFVAVLLVALSPPVLIWNATIATESLAVSLLATGIAFALRVATGACPRSFPALLFVLVALACTRDTNDLLLLVVAFFALLVALARPSLRRRALAMVVVCTVAAGVNMGLAAKAHRWYHPLTETIAVRILGSRTATDYFVARGMPHDGPVRELHTHYLSNTSDLYAGPQYALFRTWVIDHGRSTYASFLESHPGWVFGKPFADRKRLLAPDLPYGVLHHDDPRGAFLVIGAIAFPGNVVLVEVWIGVGLLAAAMAGRRRSRRRVVIVVGTMALLVVPAFLAAWHGDALEVDRHSLSAAVQLRVVLWIAVLIAVDVYATNIRAQRLADGSRERST